MVKIIRRGTRKTDRPQSPCVPAIVMPSQADRVIECVCRSAAGYLRGMPDEYDLGFAHGELHALALTLIAMREDHGAESALALNVYALARWFGSIARA